MLSNTLLAVVTLSMASFYLHASNNQRYQQRMEIMGRIIAAALTDAVIADDIARIDVVVGGVIDANNNMIRVCVFNRKGQRLSTGRCQSLAEAPEPGERIHETPVIAGGAIFGAVGIAYSATAMEYDIHQLEINLWLIAGVLMLVSLIIAWIAGDTIARHLCTVIDQMTAEQPRHLTAHSGRDELDRLAVAFNHLLDNRLERRRSNIKHPPQINETNHE